MPVSTIRAVAGFALALAFAGTAHAAPKQEECEENSIVASGYRATEAGLDIEVRAGNRLVVNGREVARQRSGMRWRDTTNTAFIARAGDNIIVATDSDDCVDVEEHHFYILDTKGRVRVFGPDWSGIGDDGFIRRGRDLIYWQRSFCYEGDPDDKNRRSYIYVLKPGARKFVRIERPYAVLCARPVRLKRPAQSLQFRPMTAVEAPRPRRKKDG